jgi:predicted O-methyltransferase YrrM
MEYTLENNMDYRQFFEQFGGSCRTKYLHQEGSGTISSLRRTLNFIRANKSKKKYRHNKRIYSLPKASNLPVEFIRLDPWEMEYLFIIASTAKRGILEIGRFNGGSVFLMACANPDIPIYSIDIKPQDDARLLNYFQRYSVGKNVELIVGDSQNAKYAQIGDVDLLFIDGDHSYSGCTRDLENWFPNVVLGGHILLHDCYSGSPVQKSVIDFIVCHYVQIIQSPYIHATHWHNPCGSLAHIMKQSG